MAKSIVEMRLIGPTYRARTGFKALMTITGPEQVRDSFANQLPFADVTMTEIRSNLQAGRQDFIV